MNRVRFALFRDDAATTVRKSANFSTPESDEIFLKKALDTIMTPALQGVSQLRCNS